MLYSVARAYESKTSEMISTYVGIYFLCHILHPSVKQAMVNIQLEPFSVCHLLKCFKDYLHGEMSKALFVYHIRTT